MRAIHGAHPAGGLRPSNSVPDRIVRIHRINDFEMSLSQNTQ
jgi:hypothetical protein